MAPIKRGADGAAASTNGSRHSTDDRAAKRQRKSDVSSKSSKAKAEESIEEKQPKASKPAQASVLKEEERSFPRGGASVLTPLEHKQIQIKATQDVLFEQAGGKQRATQADDSDAEAAVGDEHEQPTSKKRRKAKGRKMGADSEKDERGMKIEGLSYKRIVAGSMVLGQVTQITSRDVSLALPNNLTGYIPLTAISDQLTSRVEKLLADDEAKDEADNQREGDDDEDVVLDRLVTIGQYLRAYVTSTSDDAATKGVGKGKKRIELSTNPKLANSGISKSDVVVNSTVQASVISVEDHGLIMDLGLEDGSVKGFVSSREVGHNIDHTKIEEGAVFLCLVTGLSSNGKIVKLSADHQRAGNIKKSNFLTDAPTVDAFLPGTAVELLVTEVSSSGLAGQIMGMLDATADLIHSGAGESSRDITSSYKVGEKVKARVICTFPDVEPRRLGVSVLEHVLSLTSRVSREKKDSLDPLRKLPLSSFVEEAKVVKVEAGRGVFMDVDVKGVLGFAHISRLSDSKVETLSSDTGPYKVGSTHRARVVGYNPMDGLYLVSLEKKILDQPFLRIEDVAVGQVVSGKVERLVINAKGVGGVLINLAEGITGLAPEMHMADVHLQHPEKKFREGMSVKARVLSTDPDKRQIRLTLKKSLVNSDAGVWSDYKQISPGDQAPGALINILKNGAVVQFYGNVRAFLPISEMSEAYILDPRQHFRVGQVVNVRVLDVTPEEGKMTVSCKDPSAASLSQQTAIKELVIGSIVNGTVTEKSSDSVTLELEGSGLKAILRIGQLTDGSEKKDHSMFNKIRVGQKMQDLVVLEKLEKRPLVVLTNKPSLLKTAKVGTLVTRFEDVTEGKEVNGFVRNITLESVFVQFAGGVTGLMLRSQLTEDMVKTADFGLRKAQSLSPRVLAVDPIQQRFLLTMRPPKEESKDAKATSTSHPVAFGETVVNPVDGELKSMADFTFGKATMARISAVKDTQLNVQLADNVQGRIDVSEAFDDWEDIKDRKHPLQKFKAKQVIAVRVLGIHDARNHRFLPITHRTGRVPVYELSAKARNHLQSDSDVLTLSKLEIGSSWIAFVNNIADNCVWVNLTPNARGRVDLKDLTEDISLLSNVEQNFPIGSALRVHVKSVDVSANRLDLTATSTVSSKPLTLQTLTPGMVLPARVTKVTERSVIVQLSETVSGPVTLTELADDYDQANPAAHHKNDIVRVCVLDVNNSNKRITLSMRPSKVLSSSLPVKDPQISNIRELKVNEVVRGFVKNVAEKGLFVSLGPNITAFVRISDLSDSFIKEWQTAFQVDQLITGKVLAVDPEINHVQISLKASVIDKDYVPPLTIDDLKPGQVVTGKVRKVEDFGVFIVVDNSNNVSGLCHRSQIADAKIEDVKKLYDEGDAVKAMVLKVDKEKRRINFGLKASYFEDSADASDVSDEEEDVGGVELDGAASESDDEMEDGGIDLEDVKSIESDEVDGDASEGGMDVDETPTAKPATGLSTGAFDWSGNSLGRNEDRTEQSEGDDKHKKKKRRKAEIQVDKTGDLDKYGPQSVADFERQLLGQPNSSSLWIQYMAFQLQLNEVDKAREIAERALKTINIREEEEKMNVWIALLNLENTFGNDESLEEVFRRACQYNDAEEMHERLASIYIDSSKHDKADALFQTMTKNKTITANLSFWLNYATFLMTTLSAPSRARALLQRATQSVPASQHRLLTAKFGALEFQSPHGDPERGRTIFEGLLSTFPKKWDLWDMFVDLEKAKGEKENVRRLFERMAGTRMKGRRAKFVFKRWLEWEEGNGDAKSVERVKARAAEYVEGLKKGGEEGEE